MLVNTASCPAAVVKLGGASLASLFPVETYASIGG
jgi:hypothetical protein